MAYRTKICDQGGIFNASRPSTYSAETRKFLNDLIKESRLTTLQRKSLESSLRSGCGTSSSPSLQDFKTKPKTPADKTIKRYHSTKPRTLKDIVESGAYEPEAYMPSRRQKNYAMEKEKLQRTMEFGKVTKVDPKPLAKQMKSECTEKELIDSVILEIEDREKFLMEMEMLGQGPKYRPPIIQTIQDRLRQLETICKLACSNYRLKEIQDIDKKYKNVPESPKPEWF